MKFRHLNIPKKTCDKLKIVVMGTKKIFKQLEKISEENLKKHGSTLQASAVYDIMLNRCIMCSDRDRRKVLIDEKRYKKILRDYSRNAQSPFDFKVEKFNPIIHMFTKYDIPEC